MAATSPTDLRGASQASGRARLASLIQRQGALIALVALVIFGTLRYDGFVGAYNIAELLRYNSMFGLIGLGMTFVIMTGGIDLSVPGSFTLAAMLTVGVGKADDERIWVAIGVALLAVALVGLVNGILIGGLGLNALIVTLAVGQVVSGIASPTWRPRTSATGSSTATATGPSRASSGQSPAARVA